MGKTPLRILHVIGGMSRGGPENLIVRETARDAP